MTPTELDALGARIRLLHKMFQKNGTIDFGLLVKAADAIAALRDENEKLRDESLTFQEIIGSDLKSYEQLRQRVKVFEAAEAGRINALPREQLSSATPAAPEVSPTGDDVEAMARRLEDSLCWGYDDIDPVTDEAAAMLRSQARQRERAELAEAELARQNAANDMLGKLLDTYWEALDGTRAERDKARAEMNAMRKWYAALAAKPTNEQEGA